MRVKTQEHTLPPTRCPSSRTPCWKDALSHGTLQQAWASLKKSHENRPEPAVWPMTYGRFMRQTEIPGSRRRRRPVWNDKQAGPAGPCLITWSSLPPHLGPEQMADPLPLQQSPSSPGLCVPPTQEGRGPAHWGPCTVPGSPCPLPDHGCLPGRGRGVRGKNSCTCISPACSQPSGKVLSLGWGPHPSESAGRGPGGKGPP